MITILSKKPFSTVPIVRNTVAKQINKLKSRADSLKALKEEEYDLVILGGGASGVGTLLSATQRGLKCAIIEKYDFAAVTSSRSTKLAHGGIRYLEQAVFEAGDRCEKVELVFEALGERDFILSSAPFLSKPIALKVEGTSIWNNLFNYAGTVVYYLLYRLSLGLRTKPLVSGPKLALNSITFSEGQFDDSRLTLISVLTSCSSSKPAVALNYMSSTKFNYSKEKKISGIEVKDELTGETFNVRAKTVVNTTGIFADEVAKIDSKEGSVINGAKGTHIVFRKEAFSFEEGYCIPKTSDGRILFILPFKSDYWLVGTTDVPSEKLFKVKDEVSEIDFIVGEVESLANFKGEELRNLISSKFTGIRPLVFGGGILLNR